VPTKNKLNARRRCATPIFNPRTEVRRVPTPAKSQQPKANSQKKRNARRVVVKRRLEPNLPPFVPIASCPNYTKRTQLPPLSSRASGCAAAQSRGIRQITTPEVGAKRKPRREFTSLSAAGGPQEGLWRGDSEQKYSTCTPIMRNEPNLSHPHRPTTQKIRNEPNFPHTHRPTDPNMRNEPNLPHHHRPTDPKNAKRLSRRSGAKTETQSPSRPPIYNIQYTIPPPPQRPNSQPRRPKR
jgi:hypothetical protein